MGTACELARTTTGLRIGLVDPAPARGASYYAGGMLAPVAEVLYQQQALFPLMVQAASLYPRFVASVAAASEHDPQLSTTGTVVVGADRADAQYLQDLAKYQRRYDMHLEEISVAAARRLEPALSPRLAGAVYIPGDHHISPRAFLRTLRDSAEARGIDFLALSAADIDPDSGQVHTLTPAGEAGPTLVGRQIVLAAGLGARDIAGWYPGASSGAPSPLALRPVYGDIIRVAVPDYQRPLLSNVVRGVVEGRAVYIIPRPDHTVAIGATVREDGRPDPQIGGLYDLLRDAIAVLPALEECDFLEISTGARPGTPDDLPYLGRVHPRLVVSTGYHRHGILLSSVGSAVGAALVREELGIDGADPLLADSSALDISACDPWRHQQSTQHLQ